MARARGFKAGRPRAVKPIATRGGRSSVKVLSSQDSTAVGRPGFKLFGKSITSQTAKAAVRRLMVRDPAVGREIESAAQHVHFNSDPKVDYVQGDQSPEILTAQPLPPGSFAQGRGVRRTVKTPRKSAPKKR